MKTNQAALFFVRSSFHSRWFPLKEKHQGLGFQPFYDSWLQANGVLERR